MIFFLQNVGKWLKPQFNTLTCICEKSRAVSQVVADKFCSKYLIFIEKPLSENRVVQFCFASRLEKCQWAPDKQLSPPSTSLSLSKYPFLIALNFFLLCFPFSEDFLQELRMRSLSLFSALFKKNGPNCNSSSLNTSLKPRNHHLIGLLQRMFPILGSISLQSLLQALLPQNSICFNCFTIQRRTATLCHVPSTDTWKFAIPLTSAVALFVVFISFAALCILLTTTFP